MKIPALVAVASIALALSIGILSINTATHNAEESSERSLRATLAARGEALEAYLNSIEQDMRAVAASPMTVDAVRDFSTGWMELGETAETDLQKTYITNNPHPTGQKESWTPRPAKRSITERTGNIIRGSERSCRSAVTTTSSCSIRTAILSTPCSRS